LRLLFEAIIHLLRLFGEDGDGIVKQPDILVEVVICSIDGMNEIGKIPLLLNAPE
jgi:hypothetical protein